MPPTDSAGRAILERMRILEPSGTVGEVSPSIATDPSGAMELTLDASRRVVAVKVIDISRLRTPSAFSAALLGAFQHADGERALACLELTGSADDFLATVERDHAARPGLTVPRVPDVSYAAYSAGRLEYASSTTVPGSSAQTSDNGYLTLRRGPSGDLIGVEVDAEWLSAARKEYLEAAVVQAADLTLAGA